MSTRKSSSQLARRINELCDLKAKEISKEFINDLDSDSIEHDEREYFLSEMISNELIEFFRLTTRMVIADLLSDPDRLKKLRRRLGSEAGNISGLNRFNSSKKLKFLTWYGVEKKRNPSLSKNNLAQRYARENPGTSEATIRRYLSAQNLNYMNEIDATD